LQILNSNAGLFSKTVPFTKFEAIFSALKNKKQKYFSIGFRNVKKGHKKILASD